MLIYVNACSVVVLPETMDHITDQSQKLQPSSSSFCSKASARPRLMVTLGDIYYPLLSHLPGAFSVTISLSKQMAPKTTKTDVMLVMKASESPFAAVKIATLCVGKREPAPGLQSSAWLCGMDGSHTLRWTISWFPLAKKIKQVTVAENNMPACCSRVLYCLSIRLKTAIIYCQQKNFESTETDCDFLRAYLTNLQSLRRQLQNYQQSFWGSLINHWPSMEALDFLHIALCQILLQHLLHCHLTGAAPISPNTELVYWPIDNRWIKPCFSEMWKRKYKYCINT